eukprot:Nk52_evm18s675 gene=Nk52_evmTU18s675
MGIVAVLLMVIAVLTQCVDDVHGEKDNAGDYGLGEGMMKINGGAERRLRKDVSLLLEDEEERGRRSGEESSRLITTTTGGSNNGKINLCSGMCTCLEFSISKCGKLGMLDPEVYYVDSPEEFGAIDFSNAGVTGWKAGFFTQFGQVASIYLNDNLIETIPSLSFSGMASNVFNINLKNNQIKSIPSKFIVNTTSTVHLDFGSNQIDTVERGAFTNMSAPGVLQLYLSDNKLESFECDLVFTEVNILTVLALDGNSLNSFTLMDFSSSPTLLLDVSKNRLTEVKNSNLFDKICEQQTQRCSVDLSDNLLTSITIDYFGGVYSLVLAGNPLQSLPEIKNVDTNIYRLNLQKTTHLHVLPQGFLPSFTSGFPGPYDNSVQLGESLSCCGIGLDNVESLYENKLAGPSIYCFMNNAVNAPQLRDLAFLRTYINNGKCECVKGQSCSNLALCKSEGIYRYQCSCLDTYSGSGYHCALDCNTPKTDGRVCMPSSHCNRTTNVCDCDPGNYFDGCYEENPPGPSPSDGGNNSKGGLSTVYIVIICVGSAVFVILVGVSIYLWRRYAHRGRSGSLKGVSSSFGGSRLGANSIVNERKQIDEFVGDEYNNPSRGTSFGNELDAADYEYPAVEYYDAMGYLNFEKYGTPPEVPSRSELIHSDSGRHHYKFSVSNDNCVRTSVAETCTSPLNPGGSEKGRLEDLEESDKYNLSNDQLNLDLENKGSFYDDK